VSESAVPEREAASGRPVLAGLVLAAGTGSRFGGAKIRAMLDGLPLVAHVLAAARGAGLERLVLVLGRDAVEARAALAAADDRALDGVLVTVNPSPERGLATSLRLGLAAATAAPAPDGVVILLGDQPRVRSEVIAALRSAAGTSPADALAVVAAYAGDGAPNPVLLLPAGWALAADLEGDLGLGRLLAADPERVVRVPVTGSNPDVDTPADLADLEAPTRSRP
jgi:CTP:molybdopterin cytidylyltransferase MocA